MDQRIYVEKKEQFNTKAKLLSKELINELNLSKKIKIRIIQVYDIFNIEEDVLIQSKKTLFKEVVSDYLYEEFAFSEFNYFALETLSGVFNQQEDAAYQGLLLLGASTNVKVRCAQLYIIEGLEGNEIKNDIINYLINPLEQQLKDLNSFINQKEELVYDEIEVIENFINFDSIQLKLYYDELSLAMSFEDIVHIQDYFKSLKRNPTRCELLVLDTYWSDHCRHTTFETILDDVDYTNSNYYNELDEAYQLYIDLRDKTNTRKPITLMNIATIIGKYHTQIGLLDDLEKSDEINACSIEIDVEDEKYLLMFKNETHNHPTEIEPFGGASTCIGGAIRDPLSGRSYVYQALRISGAANICEPLSATLDHKLAQKKISFEAALGYSSYGNQIGLATTYTHEYYHEGFKAKRMELGAVVGAVKKDSILRDKPYVGDVIIMLGGATGKDGIGGATGSSKKQKEEALLSSQSEVQKGNAPEERKIQRLFRDASITKLIKKANDFGAGGVCVAIGELADGIEVNLDLIKTKYDGLSGIDLAISESQERMAIVVDAKNKDYILEKAALENLDAYVVGFVTKKPQLVLKWHDQDIVSLDRSFLDTNGIAQHISPIIKDNKVKLTYPYLKDNLSDSITSMLHELNFALQQGLNMMFDNCVGKSTVLACFGGKYQATKQEASIQKIPVENRITNTASIMSAGYNPDLGNISPYYGASYAIIESVARLIAVGTSNDKIRLSLQEYFEKVNDDPEKFGQPVSALLGALKAQYELGVPAIGGKDSMSGTYLDLKVPPTLVSFAVSTIQVNDVISAEFKDEGDYVYYLKTSKIPKINYQVIKDNFTLINELKPFIKACSSIKNGGILSAVLNLAFGNNIGIALEDIDLSELVEPYYGGFVLSSATPLYNDSLILLGRCLNDKITYHDEVIDLKDTLTLAQAKFRNNFYYPSTHLSNSIKDFKVFEQPLNKVVKTQYSYPAIKNPNVYLPVFYGTNSEYDLKKSFEQAGGIVSVKPFVALDKTWIKKSIKEMVKQLDEANIFVLAGGFSAGDEPDGSGKYIVNVLLNKDVQAAINRFIKREGLILGICNGFQALIKSGLLPYGKINQIDDKMPTLFLNDCSTHLSHFIKTKMHVNGSPWLSYIEEDAVYSLPISHGEGKFYAQDDVLEALFLNNQVVSQYVDYDNQISGDYYHNMNGSYAAIEGITSSDGRIFGKMAHSERCDEDGLFINIDGLKDQKIFQSAIDYFRKGEQDV